MTRPWMPRWIKGEVLTGLQLQEPPPAGMPLPIVMRLTEGARTSVMSVKRYAKYCTTRTLRKTLPPISGNRIFAGSRGTTPSL